MACLRLSRPDTHWRAGSQPPAGGSPYLPFPVRGKTSAGAQRAAEGANNPAPARVSGNSNPRKGVSMAEELQGKKIAFAVANEGVEQIELTRPWEAVRDAGAETDLIAPEEGTVQAFNHLDKGDRFDVDRTFDGADAGDYDGLVLPGGVANPDQLRTVPEAVSFV